MSLNQKTVQFEVSDLLAFAEFAGFKRNRAQSILQDVSNAVASWPRFAKIANVQRDKIKRIESAQRTELFL